MFIKFVIQKQFFSYSLEEFAQILDMPCKGACVFTEKWSLDKLAYGVHTNGPYQTNPPSPDDIISYIRIDQEGQVCRIRHEERIDFHEHQILTREIVPPAAFGRNYPGKCLLCGGLERIVAREEVVTPLLLPPPSTNHHPLILTMMMMMEMAKGHRIQLFVNISSDEDVTITPSSTTTSSSLTLPNAATKTTSTNQTSSSQENTSSSFQSKLQSSPPSSNEPTSPQPLNPLLNNISDVPPRPSNPQPLQSHPSLDITLSLSSVTLLDHILDTPSPLSPQPQPQPPLTGHPIYFNYHEYNGSTCLCCFHNHNLIFSLMDEMNLMFASGVFEFTKALCRIRSSNKKGL
nr:cytochrome P450 [Tanacetum cinerariifolium]